MFSENSKKKLSSTKMPRALRARQAFFAELFLVIFAEHVNFALILAPYFSPRCFVDEGGLLLSDLR